LETEPHGLHELPRALRDDLAATVRLSGLSVHERRVDTAAGTEKVLFRLHDGATIETVLMRYERDGASPRATVCVSTQAGCPLACAFCATGKMGWARDLSAGEVVEQVTHFARALRAEGHNSSGGTPRRRRQSAVLDRRSSAMASASFTEASGRHVTNVVFMGMGEPLLPYETTLTAIRTLTHPDGFNLGARHITVSTAGVVPGILRLAEEGLQVGLAVSLHAPDDATRERIMPLNRRYPIAAVLEAVRTYIARTNRRVTFEYAMIAGVNDSAGHAAGLAALLRDLLCHVNLIPLNPVAGVDLVCSAPRDIAVFRDVLVRGGVPVTVRDTRGGAISAACGQLQTAARRRRPHER
jgi:23S rRNA (adenine2503-C2)-methyltransferase